MLNQPRTLPYAFRVIELDDWCWLFDDSERTYCCSPVPCVYLEPLYPLDGESYDFPDPAMWTARDIERRESVGIELDPEDTTPDTPRQDAWETAYEEASANHLI